MDLIVKESMAYFVQWSLGGSTTNPRLAAKLTGMIIRLGNPSAIINVHPCKLTWQPRTVLEQIVLVYNMPDWDDRQCNSTLLNFTNLYSAVTSKSLAWDQESKNRLFGKS